MVEDCPLCDELQHDPVQTTVGWKGGRQACFSHTGTGWKANGSESCLPGTALEYKRGDLRVEIQSQQTTDPARNTESHIDGWLIAKMTEVWSIQSYPYPFRPQYTLLLFCSPSSLPHKGIPCALCLFGPLLLHFVFWWHWQQTTGIWSC